MIYCIDNSYKKELIKNGFKLASKNQIKFGDIKCWVFAENNEKFDISSLDKSKFFISDKMYF